MTVYMTKTWGFGSPCGPLQFSQKGWMERARESLEVGDLVAIVGTVGAETSEDERGVVLGLMEPTSIVVSSLDYDLASRSVDYDKNGRYRWPFGLELSRAWRFTDPRPKLSVVSGRRFSMDAALGIVPLLPSEAEAIMALPREPVPLLRPATASARVEGLAAARRKATPPPSTTRTGIMHMRRTPAFTYVMEIEGASVRALKIGWAFDYKHREREFNHAAMPAIGGLRYRTLLYQLWNTAREAFRMEQSLLHSFDAFRHEENFEIVTGMTVERVNRIWQDYLIARRRLP